MIRISNSQARDIAFLIKDDIQIYIEKNMNKYLRWLESQPNDFECSIELQKYKHDTITGIDTPNLFNVDVSQYESIATQ